MAPVCIYEECSSKLDFSKIKSFISRYFGKIAVKIIRSKNRTVQTKGLLLDFTGTQKEFYKRYPGSAKSCSIILTDRLFATPDDDKRLHIRASVYSFPSIISLSGIVEGPAKPKEFYIYKQRYSSLGAWELKQPEVKKKFKGEFIDYGDRRMAEVVKGYLAQAIFFYISGNPFCEKKPCRLYNAHWQKDLIYSQITSAKFCPKHTKILKSIWQRR
jgi:hypothetical protein